MLLTVKIMHSRGLIDFGPVFGDIETSKYECIQVPYKDTWGVIMRRDSSLAEKETIMAEDLMGFWKQSFMFSVAGTKSRIQYEHFVEKVSGIYKGSRKIFAEIAGDFKGR